MQSHCWFYIRQYAYTVIKILSGGICRTQPSSAELSGSKLPGCVCTVGWVNFSEFEITVCGSCKMSKKLKWPFFLFLFILMFCENP